MKPITWNDPLRFVMNLSAVGRWPPAMPRRGREGVVPTAPTLGQLAERHGTTAKAIAGRLDRLRDKLRQRIVQTLKDET